MAHRDQYRPSISAGAQLQLEAGKSTIAEALRRIRREYDEMPGLCLTAKQAQRLWGLEPLACEALLGAMVASGYLRLGRTGYVRA